MTDTPIENKGDNLENALIPLEDKLDSLIAYLPYLPIMRCKDILFLLVEYINSPTVSSVQQRR